MRATALWVDSDEDGFHLILETEDGERHDFNVQDVTTTFIKAAAEIAQWELEGLREAATVVTVTQDDLDVLPLHKRIGVERAIEQGYVTKVD